MLAIRSHFTQVQSDRIANMDAVFLGRIARNHDCRTIARCEPATSNDQRLEKITVFRDALDVRTDSGFFDQLAFYIHTCTLD